MLNERAVVVALVGLVRVSTSKQETARQHDALDGLCVKVFEEKISGNLAVDARPTLAAAIDYLRPGDMLTVQEVDRLAGEDDASLVGVDDAGPAAGAGRGRGRGRR